MQISHSERIFILEEILQRRACWECINENKFKDKEIPEQVWIVLYKKEAGHYQNKNKQLSAKIKSELVEAQKLRKRITNRQRSISEEKYF